MKSLKQSLIDKKIIKEGYGWATNISGLDPDDYDVDNLGNLHTPKGQPLRYGNYKGKEMPITTNHSTLGGEATNTDSDDVEKLVGKDEKRNGSGGTYAVDPPTDDDLLKDGKALSSNAKMIFNRVRAGRPFFIMGHAGWGKTQIIKKMAKADGRTIITVYLDKVMKEDLGGIPVPVKDERGHISQQLAMPPWALYMLNHPETKFLLFFDEMNQADPLVQNALMPIVLDNEICGIKFDNYIVGAAGNYAEENIGVSELQGPLKSRFNGSIIWEDDSEKAWVDAFKHLHSKWDSVVGKEFVDKFEEVSMGSEAMFASPRTVENWIFDYMRAVKERGITDMTAQEFYTELTFSLHPRIQNPETDLTRSGKQKLKELAEFLYEFEQGSSSKKQSKGRTRKGLRPDDTLIALYTEGMEEGYISTQEEDGSVGVYVFSRESHFKAIPAKAAVTGNGVDIQLNAEIIASLIKTLNDKGINFKYETDQEGYRDLKSQYPDIKLLPDNPEDKKDDEFYRDFFDK